MKVSEKIFQIMELRGIKQYEFCQGTGISQSTVSDWKRKGTNPTIDKLPAICKFLNVSADCLIGARPMIHVDYIIKQENGSLDIHRGDIFQSADYDAATRQLVVRKDYCRYVFDNVVSLSMCGEKEYTDGI